MKPRRVFLRRRGHEVNLFFLSLGLKEKLLNEISTGSFLQEAKEGALEESCPPSRQFSYKSSKFSDRTFALSSNILGGNFSSDQ